MLPFQVCAFWRKPSLGTSPAELAALLLPIAQNSTVLAHPGIGYEISIPCRCRVGEGKLIMEQDVDRL